MHVSVSTVPTHFVDWKLADEVEVHTPVERFFGVPPQFSDG